MSNLQYFTNPLNYATKKLLFHILAAFILAGCSNNTATHNAEELKPTKMMKEQTNKPAAGTIMQIVKIKTELSEEELLKKAREREPQFKAIPGIIQKYYIKLGSEGEYGGVYIWDTAESLKAFKESELAATIPKAYEVIEAPSIEIVDILFQLRE